MTRRNRKKAAAERRRHGIVGGRRANNEFQAPLEANSSAGTVQIASGFPDDVAPDGADNLSGTGSTKISLLTELGSRHREGQGSFLNQGQASEIAGSPRENGSPASKASPVRR